MAGEPAKPPAKQAGSPACRSRSRTSPTSPACAPPTARRCSPTMCRPSRIPLVERIERKGGIVVAKSNTPEFGAGGSTFNEVFGRTRNPWNTSLTCGGSTGGGAVSLATGEVWLAHGSDHGGSLRRPGTYCSVVGLRPVAGPRDARHLEQSLSAAFGAGADGAHRCRPGAVPRHHGRPLPAGPHDLRCAARLLQRRRGTAGGAQARRLHRRLQRQDGDRPRVPRHLHQGGAALRGAGLHRRGGLARYRRHRRGLPQPAQPGTSSSTASCSSRSIATSSSPTSSGTPSAASPRLRRRSPGPSANAPPCSAAWSSSSRPTTCW